MKYENGAEVSTVVDRSQEGPIQPATRARIEIEMYMAGVPVKSAGRYRRALEGKPGLRNAINAKCFECVGFEETTDRVRNCSTKRCALWSYRPYQTKAEA